MTFVPCIASGSGPSARVALPRLAAVASASPSAYASLRAASIRGSARGYASVAGAATPATTPSASPAGTHHDAKKLLTERNDLFEKLKDSYVMDHHIYKQEDLETIDILHHQPKNFSDRLAHFLVKMMRSTFDFATRYPGHKKFTMVAGREKDLVKRNKSDGKRRATDEDQLPEVMPLEEIRAKGLSFTPEQWLQRCIFLESIAGCPGSVAAVARHLHSLRLLRRDKGWIHMCLEDAENERMHLLSFMAIANPGKFMRLMLLGAQGVFFNAFFALYLLHPRTCHRFVGALEEEAVVTYTGLIQDLEMGRLPEWENMEAPEIAKEYWKLPKDAKMVDMIKAIRCDEAGHRFIHHTLADLDQKNDVNPFSVATPTPHMIGTKLHLTREESLQFIEEAKRQAEEEVQNAQRAKQA